MQLWANYQYRDNEQQSSSESRIENITGQGSQYNHLFNSGFTDNSNNSLQLGLQHRDQKGFLSIQLNGNLTGGSNESNARSMITGLSRQDQDSYNKGNTDAGNGSATIDYSRNLSKAGRLFSVKLSADRQQNDQDSRIRDVLRYYDQANNPFPDSTLIRQLDMQNGSHNLLAGLKVTEPLGDQQAKVKRYIDLGYDFSLRGTESGQEMAVMDPLGQLLRVDSLSSRFHTDLRTHRLKMVYRQNTEKLSLDAGLSMEPGVMDGALEDGTDRISYRMFNVVPQGSLRYTFSQKHSASLYYTANVRPPELSQLMPIANLRNPQQVQIGNPELRPATAHSLSMELSRVNWKKGQNFSLSLSGWTVKNQVVQNVLLVADTLNSLRQETHYLNADGSYGLGAGYNMTLPFAKIYQFRFGSNAGLNRTVLYVDNQKGAGRSVSFSQDLGLTMNTKIVALNAGVNYSLGTNSYTLGSFEGSRISSMDFRGDVKFTFSALFKAGVDGSYRINRGYTIPVNNPVVINAFAEWYITKSKALSFSLWAYDLLDQQNAVGQIVTSNSITQRKMNRIGRYLMLSVKVNISRFGGKQQTM